MRFAVPSSTRLAIALSFLAVSCTKDFDPRQQSYPLIETTPVTNIDAGGAQFNGQVIKLGTDPILDVGFMYAEKPLNHIYITGPETFTVSLGAELKNNFSLRVTHNLNDYVTYNVVAYVTTAKKTVIGNPVVFKSISTSPTLITSFSPAGVLDGDILTIFGENFNRYGGNSVSFGGNQGQLVNILSDAYNFIKVTVPPISQAGPVIVTVDAGFSSSSSDQLVILNPSITSFSPTHGQAGSWVTLKGRFSRIADYNKVLFNGVPAYIYSSSNSEIIAWVPSGLSGNVTVAISVNGKTSNATNTFLVE